MLTYIRKAPLAASHHLALVALAGWERGASGSTAGVAFSPRSSVVQNRTQPARKPTASVDAEAGGRQLALTNEVRALSRRVSAVEIQLQTLAEWRAVVAASAPANVSTETITAHWASVDRIRAAARRMGHELVDPGGPYTLGMRCE